MESYTSLSMAPFYLTRRNRMHNHFEICEHELKICTVCNVVYCPKCRNEWVQKTVMYYYTYPQITYTDGTVISGNTSITDGHTHESK